jgi:hypothetical protein
MNLRPFTVARYGVYAAGAVAALSAWLGQQAGASLDFVLLRGVFVFVIFTAMAFAAEAVLSMRFDAAPPALPPAPPQPIEDRDE